MGIDLRLLRTSAAVATVAPARETQTAAASVVRFDTHQRIQHVLMMSSFITLALTGLPQKFSDLSVSQWWVDLLGGLQMVRWIHRTAGVVMLTDCLYHLSYLGYRLGVQRLTGPLRMIPTPKDARDLVQTLLYFLGLMSTKPKFDRFSYLEKFDYWAVFWGIVMIGGSGVVLMFPVLATTLLPGQVLPIAITIHSDEAILAVGWILVVHMFNVHLAPWVFPFNPAIFTGKITAHYCAEEHPLEWERITAAAASSGETAAAPVIAAGQSKAPARARTASAPRRAWTSARGRAASALTHAPARFRRLWRH
ncbi:MAG: hypothetical protein HY874_02605 [Chloroflexi bacterium]|nr:hypothetical protein [Chloroflexota bacterium]